MAEPPESGLGEDRPVLLEEFSVFVGEQRGKKRPFVPLRTGVESGCGICRSLPGDLGRVIQVWEASNFRKASKKHNLFKGTDFVMYLYT